VYVFSRRGATWAQDAYLKAGDAEPGDHFGFSLAASGQRLVVGAHKEDGGADVAAGSVLEDSGAAYLFERIDGVWQERTRLKAANIGAGDLFGLRVRIDGDTIAVSAVYEDGSAASSAAGYDDGANNAGAVYVFTMEGGRWQQRAYLKASNAEPRSDFGNGLALSGDRIVVGAKPPTAEGHGFFGNFVAMSGRTILTSAYAAAGGHSLGPAVAGRPQGTGAVVAWTLDDQPGARAASETVPLDTRK